MKKILLAITILHSVYAGAEQRSPSCKPLSTLNLPQLLVTATAMSCATGLIDTPFNFYKLRSQLNQKTQSKIKPNAPLCTKISHLTVPWKGTSINVVRGIPTTMGQVLIMSTSSEDKQKNNTTCTAPLIPAIAAGTASAVIGTPTDLLILNRQTKGKKQISMLKTVQTKPIPHIYRGFVPRALRNSSNAAGYWTFAPKLKELLLPYTKNDNVATLAANIAVCVPIMALNHPLDTLGTLMQNKTGTKKNTSIKQVAITHYKKNGYRGFYSGLVPRLVSGAVCFPAARLVQDTVTSKF